MESRRILKSSVVTRVGLLLSSALLLAALAACGGERPTPSPTASEVSPTQTAGPSPTGEPAAPTLSATATTAAEPTQAPSLEVGYEVGEMAPDFELTTIDGETLSLSDFRGDSPVLLYFFATW